MTNQTTGEIACRNPGPPHNVKQPYFAGSGNFLRLFHPDGYSVDPDCGARRCYTSDTHASGSFVFCGSGSVTCR